MIALLAILGCGDTQTVAVGDFTIDLDRETGLLQVQHVSGATLDDVELLVGEGSAEIEMQFGQFKFGAVTLEVEGPASFARVRRTVGPPWIVFAYARGGELLGTLVLSQVGDALALDWSPSRKQPAGDAGRIGVAAACDADDHFLGLGSHALDVDHVGEAFGVWTSEPGIGKSEGDAYPEDWFLTGTRHATSFPAPFVLRPHRSQGLLLDTTGRVDVDLCASDAERFQLVAWDDGGLRILWFADTSALGVVQDLTALTGRPTLPAPWVFSPWNDAIRGRAEVERVASVLREAGASTSVIWSEDWKGAEQTAFGYHLTGEWTVDETLYPDAAGLAAALEADGFKWFAYFSPFVFEGTDAWDDALAADVILEGTDGEPATWPGATFDTTSMIDLSTAAGRSWFQGYMQSAVDLGFDGWMADYAEWLPVDVALRDGRSGLEAHNAWPELWQTTNAEVLDGLDAAFFVRSGWTRTGGLVPVVWGGDQRTSFDADDGLPTVIPLGLGLSAVGVPVFTHDVAGYASVGNPTATKELWFRWASLGAYTPIFRTHHGAYDPENWKFDRDAETLAHFVAVTDEHMRLFPYRYGLAARATQDGTPMILPVAFLYGDDWARTDAWLLGEALLVAPVTEAGAVGREVSLPDSVDWYRWPSLEPASSGFADAALGEIPVFAASGTTIPTFATIPDTLVVGADPDLIDLVDVDGERVVYLIGGGGSFTEADGTSYRTAGAPTGSGEVTAVVTSGTVEVEGVTVTIQGPVERSYTLIMVP